MSSPEDLQKIARPPKEIIADLARALARARAAADHAQQIEGRVKCVSPSIADTVPTSSKRGR